MASKHAFAISDGSNNDTAVAFTSGAWDMPTPAVASTSTEKGISCLEVISPIPLVRKDEPCECKKQTSEVLTESQRRATMRERDPRKARKGGSPCWYLYLVVVGGLVCSSNPESYVGGILATDLSGFLDKNTIISGDLYAKHPTWGCSCTNAGGEELLQLMDDTESMLLNDNTLTFTSYSYNASEALDIAITSS
ncbi:hypothetical protein TNCV_5118181 [Trichonephila clavipes]|nr:hypothetical protein TNCV_5118181 [Trichonephila clavipes]